MKNLIASFGIFTTILLLTFAFISTLSAAPAVGNVIRVNQSVIDGTGTGNSWPNAYPDLAEALTVATAGDELWVATGVYVPGTAINDSFVLVDGVAIYGGFAATETMLSERNWEANVTVLSGDIGRDDDDTINGVVMSATQQEGDNSYHVVTSIGVTTTAVLDGFSITAGQADGNFPNDSGGGMYNRSGSSPTLNNITFSGNSSKIQGGGMYNRSGSNPTLNNVAFNGNSSNHGGGMYNHTSNPILRNVTFSDNNSSISGGGMLNLISSPMLSNVAFSGNSSSLGGGIYNGNSSPTLSNVAFSGNSGNSGGGMYNFASSPTLSNITFSGNSSSLDGGGMFNKSGSSPAIANSIFWNNEAADAIGTLTATLFNADAGSIPTISSSLIQKSGGSSAWDSDYGNDGGNNINGDPLFKLPVDPTTAPTLLGNLQLQTDSPAIDAGSASFYTSPITTDLAGNTRIQDSMIDMGPYEHQPPVIQTIYLPAIFSASSGFSIGLASTVASRPTSMVDEIFFSSNVAFPTIAAGKTAYLSSNATAFEPVLVDDVLQLKIGDTLALEHDFAPAGVLAPAVLQLTAPQISQLSGQMVTVIFKDKYEGYVQATQLFLLVR